VGQANPLPKILFMPDESLPKERQRAVAQTMSILRRFAKVEFLDGHTHQRDVLRRIEKLHFDLLLVPWHRYLKWNKVDGHLGLTRDSGTAFAGYFGDAIDAGAIEEISSRIRMILLDFYQLRSQELNRIILALAQDTWRSGIRPLVDFGTKIYSESWYGHLQRDTRSDVILKLPEVVEGDWVARRNSIRICLSALWSLVYEEGPGKGTFIQAMSGVAPRAYFQLGASAQALFLRLCYSKPSWNSVDVLKAFWPGTQAPSSSSQLLLRFADFVRVHTITEQKELEVVVGFWKSAPAEKDFHQLRTIWVGPLSERLVQDIPYESPGPQAPHLVALPTPELENPGTAKKDAITVRAGAKPQPMVEASVTNVRQLMQEIESQKKRIDELKAGGVGSPHTFKIPEAENLIEAFHERFFEAQYQIRQFQLEIMAIQDGEGGANQPPEKINDLKRRMQELAEREKGWIESLGKILHEVKKNRQGPKASALGGGEKR